MEQTEMRKFMVPTSSRLQKATDLDRKLVLMRDGVLAISMILPPEREHRSREWLLLPLDGQRAWRTLVVEINDLLSKPESLDLALDRIELGFEQVERTRLGDVSPGALVITPTGTFFIAEHFYRDRRRAVWMINAELSEMEQMDEDDDSHGLVAKRWSIFGFRAGELVLEHQVNANEAA